MLGYYSHSIIKTIGPLSNQSVTNLSIQSWAEIPYNFLALQLLTLITRGVRCLVTNQYNHLAMEAMSVKQPTNRVTTEVKNCLWT